jgi:hypothetical protein
MCAVLAVVASIFAQGMAWRDEAPQEERESKERQQKGREFKRTAEHLHRSMEVSEAFEHFGDKQIKGAPFSAQVIIENTQTLANGSHISRKVTGGLHRDGEGRTRREMPSEGATEMVIIDDPVASVNYQLHLSQQKARKLTIEGNADSEHVRAEKRHAVEMEEKHRAEEVAHKMKAEQGGKRVEPEKKIESLGTQTVEGTQASGTRVTITVPAGKEGNDQPFDIVYEKWYSPELQMIVMSRHSDPRSGEHIYRLANIKLSEPPHSLFEVPPGFTITEEKVERRRQ